MSDRDAPVIIDLDPDDPGQSPAEAPPVPDFDGPAPDGRAMQAVAALATRRPSPLARWFWGTLAALVSLLASVALWRFVEGLIAANPVIGTLAVVVVVAFVVVLLVVALRELLAYFRLGRLDNLHRDAEAAVESGDPEEARAVFNRLMAFYSGREELAEVHATTARHAEDIFDAPALFGLAEQNLLAPLDEAATRQIEAAARQVATVTALVPLAFADIVSALTANLRMIRRIAELYGGRAGTFGSWRLTRTVLTHLVATGAVAVGDDLISSIAGGGVLSKISRRFGEGVLNGALTARVGISAVEVCRPLPFMATRPPRTTALVRRALTGLFGTAKDTA